MAKKLLLLSLLMVLLFPVACLAQVTLLTPANNAKLSSPPTFAWSGPPSYDAYLVYGNVYLDTAGFTGYRSVTRWLRGTRFVTPSRAWDKVGTGQLSYWAVYGYDIQTQSGAWSETWAFEKVGCGPLTGTIYDVDNVSDMLAALQAAGPGDTVRLAPGTYVPPVQSWSGSGYSNIYANCVVENGVTLAGSGQEQTTVVVSGTGGAIFAHGDATLRDLRIQPSGSQGWLIFAGNTNLTLCSVDINGSSSLNYGYGIYFQPWESGSYDLTIIDSDIGCSGCTEVWGIFLDGCYTVSPPSITGQVQNTTVSGWETGLRYDTGDYGCNATISVTADCAGFSGNTYNVRECNDGGCTEHCP